MIANHPGNDGNRRDGEKHRYGAATPMGLKAITDTPNTMRPRSLSS
jgi:hypothetical protein